MSRHGKHTIFMMDLWATVPYYTAYLSQALLAAGAGVMIGSISYYLDRACFTSRNLPLEPGLLDVVSRLSLPASARRLLKLAEAILNMAALVVRFTFHPPAVVHVQYLPLLRWKLPIERWFLSFCRLRGASIVLTVHDLLPHDTAESYKAVFASLYTSVDLLICHSASIRTRLQQEFHIPATRIAVIPHGPFFYDIPPANQQKTLPGLGIESGHTNFLWQGIIFPYKGVDLLLEAWQVVEAAHPGARLIIAGTGSPALLEQIHQNVTRLNLKQVKLLLRFISTEELVALYRLADVVVYPYRAITTSGALATGLAFGKTIVAADLSVFRELLTDRQNALLVDPTQPPALANALLELMNDPGLRHRLAGSVRALNFGDQSWSTIAQQTIQAYQQATA